MDEILSKNCPPGYIDEIKAELPPEYRDQIVLTPEGCSELYTFLGAPPPATIATKIVLGMKADVLEDPDATVDVDAGFVERLKEGSQIFSQYPR